MSGVAASGNDERFLADAQDLRALRVDKKLLIAALASITPVQRVSGDPQLPFILSPSYVEVTGRRWAKWPFAMLLTKTRLNLTAKKSNINLGRYDIVRASGRPNVLSQTKFMVQLDHRERGLVEVTFDSYPEADAVTTWAASG